MEYTTATILNNYNYTIEITCDECKEIFTMEKAKYYNYCPFCGKKIIQKRY
jgi:DNA-directed RNA polymerase subunit RPC12/RpoP